MDQNYAWNLLIEKGYLFIGLKIALIIGIGIPFVWMLTKWIESGMERSLRKHVSVLFSNVIFYACLSLLVITVLNELGFSVATLLGAAGVVGVGLGLASQRSLSNIISGIFLLFEGSVSIGDIISYQETTGKVESIDLLSCKVKTFDGRLVRIPNETILQSVIKNRTFYPIRRLEVKIRIEVNENIHEMIELILASINEQHIFLKEPKPSVSIGDVGMFSTELIVWAWVKTKDFPSSYNIFAQNLKLRFEKESKAVAINRIN